MNDPTSFQDFEDSLEPEGVHYGVQLWATLQSGPNTTIADVKDFVAKVAALGLSDDTRVSGALEVYFEADVQALLDQE